MNGLAHGVKSQNQTFLDNVRENVARKAAEAAAKEAANKADYLHVLLLKSP